MNFEKIAAQYKLPTGSVEKEYNKIKEELASSGLVGDELETRTIEITHLHLRSQGKSKAELYFGVVVGYDYPRDMANLKGKVSKRDSAVDAAKANISDAINSGKVAVLKVSDETHYSRTMLNSKTGVVATDNITTDMWKDYVVDTGAGYLVVPLDNMKVFPGGIPNSGYLKPLPLYQWTTEVEGITKLANGKYSRFTLNYRQPKHPGVIPMYSPVEFKAIPKGEKDGVLQLNSSTYTEFVPSKMVIGADVADLMDVAYGSVKLLTAQIEEYYEAHKDKPFDTLVLLDGYVADVRLDTTVPTIQLDDFSKPGDNPNTRVALHQGIPINFGIESKVLVLGRTKRSNWNPETKQVEVGYEGEVSINAMGVYPRFSNKPAGIKPVETLV